MRERSSLVLARLLRFLVIWVPPRRKGMTLLAKVERHASYPKRLVRGRHVSGYSIDLDLSDAVQKSMYFRGTWEPAQTALITECLKEGDVFLDVGANAGHYTLVAARAVGSSGHVHAIEASPPMAARLERTVRGNQLDERVTVHAFAAGDAPAVLYLQPGPGAAREGSRWLDPTAQAGEQVPVEALDAMLSDLARCDVIKTDVEGSDLRALTGAIQLIRRCRPKLIIAEAAEELLRHFGDDPQAMVMLMRDLGYRGAWLEDNVESPTLVFRPESDEQQGSSAIPPRLTAG